MYLVSVIVPIFNVEKYLGRCLDSLIRQSYHNIEIILVDDGSNDLCPSICDHYSKIDSRIIVLHKSNGGLSDARNKGIEVSSGDYITFVDSDDYVSDNYIEVLLSNIITAKAEMSVVGLHLINEEKIRFVPDSVKPRDYPIVIIDSKDVISQSLDVNFRVSSWAKLYKKSLFDCIRFPIGRIYEDLAIWFDLLNKTTNVVFQNVPLYYYVCRRGSITNSSFYINQFYSLRPIQSELTNLLSLCGQLSDKIYGRLLYEELGVYYCFRKSRSRNKYKEEYLSLRDTINKHILSIKNFKDIKNSIRLRIMSYRCGWFLFVFVNALLSLFISFKKMRYR